MSEPLPIWLEKLRGKEGEPLPEEIAARFAKKLCPRCGTEEDVLVNKLGVYCCVAEECVHAMSPRYGIALWWKFDPARDGGEGKDHVSQPPHKAGWVHGTRVVVRQVESQPWMPRPDASSATADSSEDRGAKANTWDAPKRRKPR